MYSQVEVEASSKLGQHRTALQRLYQHHMSATGADSLTGRRRWLQHQLNS